MERRWESISGIGKEERKERKVVCGKLRDMTEVKRITMSGDVKET